MATVHLIMLAVVQGVTEFLPISSSAHLIILPRITGWTDQGLAFDVAAHLGSLAAVSLYFRRDILVLGRAWTRTLTGAPMDGPAKLAWGVLLGTLPVGVVGLFAPAFVATTLRSVQLIAAATILFGVALWLSDRLGERSRGLDSFKMRDALLIGCAQAIALIPGTSRSGITITAALALGMTREAAARFSFLLSIPVIVLASGLEIVQLAGKPAAQPWGELAAVVFLSGLSAFICIHAFLKFVERVGMAPFVLYRIAFGAALLWYFA